MNVLIRADASLSIGAGHIMRCLSLADGLTSSGAQCAFVSRNLPGNFNDALRKRGYHVFTDEEIAYSDDVEAQVKADTVFTQHAVEQFEPQWLLVDHYGLDAQWERVFVEQGIPVAAIDDVANRPHAGNVLIDQNLGRRASDYNAWVEKRCKCLIGPKYALLRPQFYQQRSLSRVRSNEIGLRSLLISMGGADENNATGAILRCLAERWEQLHQLSAVNVVMGQQSKWLEEVQRLAVEFPVPVNVLVGVDDMAVEMQKADLAIGAGGTTSWERCCLGLPSVVFTLAENQTEIAQALDKYGAAIHAGSLASPQWRDLLIAALERLRSSSDLMKQMSKKAFQVTDGLGVPRVCQEVFGMTIDWEAK